MVRRGVMARAEQTGRGEHENVRRQKEQFGQAGRGETKKDPESAVSRKSDNGALLWRGIPGRMT